MLAIGSRSAASSLCCAATRRDPMATIGSDMLSWFEVPRPMIEPALRALRLGNTVLDALFYDVNTVVTDLLLHGSIVVAGAGETSSLRTSEMTKTFSQLDLSALSNPEGSILVVDSGRPPHVTPFVEVPDFLSWVKTQGQTVRTASVTGVGSSALGSVAFAWNISTALDEPVAAIVPGYGVADVIQQGLGGWFGFGLHNWWVKQMAQQVLAHTMPRTARIGRHLMMTAPGHAEASTGAPVFQRGSGSSDVLHAILKEAPNINRVLGHSKGALVIDNAILSLPAETTRRLHVVTFGCPIGEDTPTAGYSQYLGLIDGLGLLNSWGNRPETLLPAHHSTNTSIPFSMPVSVLARLATPGEAPRPPAITHQPALLEGPQATTTRQRNRIPRRR
jgi:hypothetical protein